MTRTAIPQITVGEVLSNRTCLPPPDEQRHIIDYIEALNCAFDELSLASTSAIQLLQERRSTLISVAVTGQIDVRGLTQAEVVA
jgi:type I restriction enzyme S subunit